MLLALSPRVASRLGQVIIGAFALRRGGTVMLTLVPAALGLALGAGQGSTLAKALLPSSRQPARFAALVVSLSLPTLASLLGVINQLLASHFGTLACLCILLMLAVWLPHGGPFAQIKKLVSKSATEANHPIIDPARVPAVVAAIGYRKWLVTGWMVLAVIFICLYLGFSTATSMVTDQLADFQREFSTSVNRAQRGVSIWPLLNMLLTGANTVLAVVAKTYLAQAFYTDGAVTAVVTVWHVEKADDEDTGKRRAAELAEVADALGLTAAERVHVDSVKGEQTRARDRVGETVAAEV